MKRQRKPSKQAKGSWHKWKSERDDDKAKAVIFHGHKSQEAEKNNIWQSNLSGNCRNHWYDNILGNLLAAECPVIGMIPPPSLVFNSLSELLRDPDYWESW